MPYYPPRYLFRRYEIMQRLRPGDSFLEVGAGNLYLAKDLLAYFGHGTLVDFNYDEVMSAYHNLPRSLKNRLDLIIADFSISSPLKGTYDCVISCEVMEHISKDGTFLSLLFEHLNSGGQLILSVPAKMRYWSIHDELAGHIRRYEKGDLKNLLYAQGYEDVKIISYGYPFVNILRWIRIMLARFQKGRKAGWSQKKQTQKSGIVRTNFLLEKIGLLINKYSLKPLSRIATHFNDHDLSCGYVVTAIKPSSPKISGR